MLAWQTSSRVGGDELKEFFYGFNCLLYRLSIIGD